ncbi:tail fiber domain-containing protein [[Clostridium] innocuum]|uniref:tail fiber domain-containing protein n=1 Tax=Clostridium innocuum TaxID=1522 RepID=UPI001F56F7C7|nr:tail fiber domain-containing protein [[Clostridium] innocuum]MCI2994731.1 tail fiber domain-containing protein [[Clostridium] innocuum]MCR0544742.1 tail fiber domain-containing protein [[Clostridium] innocuum]
MITTSDKYKTAISKSGRHFRLKIDIAGTAYTGIKSFKLKGGTNSSEQITFGDAVSSYIEFILTDVPKNTILKGRQAIPYIGLELDDGTVEWIKKGVYNLEKPVRSGEFIKLTAYDNFALCYKGFFTGLSGNQKIDAILQEQCKKIGIEYAGGADDVTYKVDSLQGLTIIEAVSVLAAYCGKNAVMDKDGKLRLVWYTDAGLTISPSRFADPLEMDEEDTFINRLDCTIDEEHSVSAGTGVGIYFSCPGMTQERITVLYNRIKGFTYRAAKLNWRMAQPDVEAGDLVRVMDNAGNAYVIPLMDYEFSCDGGFYGTVESKGKTEQEQDTGYKGPLQTKVDRTYSDLVSTKQVITDKITAFEGEFETINTNYLEVNKKLIALDAEIENLDVTELTAKVAIIETSYVSKEYVQDLYATKAEVHVLDVDLERVNTLLAGSVTAGSTQTIVLNADNTTISNALIKSAMIDSVAADKVTAGTIDASSIHFKSQSGRLDIYGETLQIKDITRPRVQIGKDASGDYNMYVWDAAGKLMFDAAGITASGIQRPIIVDSMVADNANISGDKINITSLVKEINDGTEVIKSSHILVDGANQSLSVVYNTIKGDISTLSTALSVEQGKISSLITDVSQAKGDVSTLQTNYSSLIQTVNGINSTVSSHSTSIDNLNNMEIGGRNLITNTRPDKAAVNYVTSKWSVQIVDEATAISGKAMQATCTAAGTGGIYHGGSRKLETGKKYTWMVFVKASKAVRLGLGSEQNGILYCDITTEWNKFTHTFTANSNTHYQFIFYTANAADPWAVGDIVWYHSLILVEGDKAPTWVPAPEDIDASIKTVSDKTTTLEQTVNGFSGRISSVETTANSASSKVTEITATVNGLSTTVANKTDKGAIISTINQSAEAIKIQASKLELTGYVTMTNLSTSGQTTIDGGNIKTGTITAAKIASGTITATQIAGSTITGAKIAAGTITATQIASNAITAVKIASKTITADKISISTLSALTANLGTVTAGSLTSNTTISVSTNLTVGNNIYLNQNVNSTKYIYFNSSNYIRNLYTNSYNYITVNSNYRCALVSGSTSVYAYGNTGEAGISAAASIIFSSYGNGRLEHYGKYYDANWSSGFFRPLQAGTALGGSGASYRWYRLYAANTCSTSSDIRLKTNVKRYDVRYESMYMDLKPVTYELISTPGKTQCGLIAQWVKEAMDKNGIAENELALYEHDIREDSYSISYEQLTSLNMHMVQKTIKRVDKHDEDIMSIRHSMSNYENDTEQLRKEVDTLRNEVMRLNNELFDTKSALRS